MIQKIETIKNFLPSKEKIAANLKLYLEVVYMRFISCQKICFQFGSWSIPYNCLHKIPEMKLIARVILLHPFWQKLNFISGDTYPEMIWSERKHSRMQIFHKSKGSWSKD